LLPHRAEYRDRGKCWVCGFFADEFDILKEFGVTDYSQRLLKIEDWRTEYDRLPVDDSPALPRGASREVGMAWADLQEWLERDPDWRLRFPATNVKARGLITKVLHVCHVNGCDVLELVEYWEHFANWAERLDREHQLEGSEV
jgi:hypothetical protein